MAASAGIVVPVFDTGAFLEECLRSVTRQTWPARVVVVDDGSTDPVTLEILERWEDRVQVVRHPVNRGVGAALNTGVEACPVDYMLVAGSDDIVEPDFVAEAMSVFEADPAVGVVSSYLQFFGARNHLWEVDGAPRGMVDLLYGNQIPGPSMFSVAGWRDVGGFAVDIPWGEDWEFWVRLIAAGWTSAVIPRPLYRYRTHPAQATARFSPREKEQWHAEIVRRNRAIWSRHIEAIMADYWRQAAALQSFKRRFALLNDAVNAGIGLFRKLRP